MIELINVSKKYNLGKQRQDILKNLNLKLPNEGLVYLEGESGSGKSTILNIIGGLDSFNSGKYIFNGKDTSKFGEDDWAKIRKEYFGIIFQEYNLIENISVFENVQLSYDICSANRDNRDKKIFEALCSVGMWGKRAYLPSQLSGGQKQRVAIARALINDSRIILADEPTGALDSKNAYEIMSILKKIASTGKLVLLVTHSKDYRDLADSIIHLKDGKIIDVVKNKNFSTDIDEKKAKININKVGHLRNGLLLRLAFKNIGNKRRFLLTVIASAIGVTGILLINYLTVGINNYIDTEFKSYNTNDILFASKHTNNLITSAEKRNIQKLSGINKTYQDTMFITNLKAKSKSESINASNLLPVEKQDVYLKNDLKYGIYPTKNKEIMVPEKIAKNLYGSNKKALNNHVDVTAQIMTRQKIMPVTTIRAKIVGITKNKIASNLNLAYVSYPLSKSLSNSGESTGLLIFPKRKRISSVKKKLENMGYYVLTPQDDLEIGKQYMSMIFIFLGLITGISLIVSAIMIGIVVYVSILERKKEIGILKTLGVYKREIQKLFVIEGIILSGSGWLVGSSISLLLSLGLNPILKRCLSLESNILLINFKILMISLGFSLLLGVMAAFIPAQKAAKKKIIAVLK